MDLGNIWRFFLFNRVANPTTTLSPTTIGVNGAGHLQRPNRGWCWSSWHLSFLPAQRGVIMAMASWETPS